MTSLYNEHSAQIIKGLNSLLRKRLDAKQAKLIGKFVLHYFSSVATDELQERELENLYGALLSHWRFICQRQPGEVKVRVYNPSLERDGWKSTHTVIEASHDDMPFLVDTILIAINRMGMNIHFIVNAGDMYMKRDANGNVVDVITSKGEARAGATPEAQIFIEIDRQPDDPNVLNMIKHNIEAVLADVRLVVSSFTAMKSDMADVIENFNVYGPRKQVPDIDEYVSLLEMLQADHFTFLGSACYDIDEMQYLVPVAGSRHGLLKDQNRFTTDHFVKTLIEPVLKQDKYTPLLITKSDERSSVHRSAHMDMLVIRRYNKQGKTVGICVFVGLFTSAMYHSNPETIPLLRQKVETILRRSGFALTGHDGKALMNILESFPRDELFQILPDQLFITAMGILQIQERQRIRLFVRRDVFGRYYSCMVYVPRDLYNTELRIKMQNILMREFDGIDSTFSPNFLESVLCRIDFVIRVDLSAQVPNYDIKKIESKLVVAARSWKDDLRDSLVEALGETEGTRLADRYYFSAGYRESFLARSAVVDIQHIEKVLEHPEQLGMCFYRMLEEDEDFIHFKLFRIGQGLPLTDVLPLLENMGLRVIEERPYQVTVADDQVVWISDFGMQVIGAKIDLDAISERFKAAFAKIWEGSIENDGFNSLVIRAQLSWQEILILRVYAKYLLQIGSRYSSAYIESALGSHAQLAKLLVNLFQARFDPQFTGNREQVAEQLVSDIDAGLEAVINLDSDRIIRRYRNAIMATLRTNYFQGENGLPKPFVSIKLKPGLIADMPHPHPLYEIFVYSPRMEGVHLRGAQVARGGLRWSDRLEDYRTEVLGLMKAQQVKNALIVPLGAKGGFVAKKLPTEGGRDALMEEGVRCYKTFIKGLLDVTDNLVDGEVVPPQATVRHDGDDSYLVVAADKGTATFSDIANGVAQDYGFWMGDAFASGGSNGYDHKKMGITAKGAWESVKRHFMQFGHDTQNQDFTVVGIGDMSGDVFGNGMLLSEHIRLVAAFNHLHIFIDPNPDAAKSWQERKRLFDLPRSTWMDYNNKVISKGGGVFKRSAKVIKLSPEIQQLLDLSVDELEPLELIQAILCAKVDLLWNGGIGTYVKATSESHHDVGDPANDSLRVNADELRCRVVGEGGNLGFTQLARVEFAQGGGLIYTDAIDNSAGVNCSDHEVNIKIALDAAIADGRLTMDERNKMLADMEGEVAELVLQDNYRQTQAISSGVVRKGSMVMNIRLIHELERESHLVREHEFLPSDKVLMTRHADNGGLTTPEFSVLMAYSKTVIKEHILQTDLSEDADFRPFLEQEFPVPLREKFGDLLVTHPLCREIIATQVTNTIVHHMGITYVHRMYDETGAPPDMSARAFYIAYQIYDVPLLWAEIEALDGKVAAEIQYHMMENVFRQLRRSCRWMLRNHRSKLNVSELVSKLKPAMQVLLGMMESILGDAEKQRRQVYIDQYCQAGVDEVLAIKMASYRYLSAAMDIVDASIRHEVSIKSVAAVYSELNMQMNFGWFRTELGRIRDHGYWELLSGSSLKDDLDKLQRILTTAVLQSTPQKLSAPERVVMWRQKYDYLVRRWLLIAEDIQLTEGGFERYLVAIRSLVDLAQVCTYGEVT